MISLRHATQADLPALKALFVQTIQQACTNDYTPAEIKVWTSTVENADRWQLMLDTQCVLVAHEGDAVAGFGTLKEGNYLDFMYVHPDFLRRGIASQLLEALEKEAQKHSTATISSDISITARPFFERKGYVVIRKNHNERDGEVLINFKMEKSI